MDQIRAISSIPFSRSRKSVPALPLIQTKRPQQADACDEHILCPVPPHRVVQQQSGASALRRHTNQLQGKHITYLTNLQ